MLGKYIMFELGFWSKKYGAALFGSPVKIALAS